MLRLIPVLICVAALCACGGPKSSLGFRLPDGDTGRGKQAFVALHCNTCHKVEGTDVPFSDAGAASVPLGGRTVRVKTYGELVTSIINPSHRIAAGYAPEQVTLGGQSVMAAAYLNDVMTVQQLIDLVAFLQSRYQVMPPPVSPYGYEYPPMAF